MIFFYQDDLHSGILMHGIKNSLTRLTAESPKQRLLLFRKKGHPKFRVSDCYHRSFSLKVFTVKMNYFTIL